MPEYSPEDIATNVRRTHAIDYPVPHIEIAENAPLHVRQFGDDAYQNRKIDRQSGVPFISEPDDLYTRSGSPLPIVPVYSDRLASGTVPLPFSKQPFMLHGGPGFGANPDRYGGVTWAMGHNPRVGYDTPAQMVTSWSKSVIPLAKQHGGVTGAVWLGSQDAHKGNVALMHAAMHEMEWLRVHDPEHYGRITAGFHKYPRMYSSVQSRTHLGEGSNKFPTVEDFLKTYTQRDRSMKDRYEIMSDITGKSSVGRGKEADADRDAFIDFFKQISDSITDYKHVPKGHVVSIVRFDGTPAKFDLHTHPAYKWLMPGTYQGELHRTVPLADLIPQIRIGPIKSGKLINDLFVQHNPYHEEVKTDIESLMRSMGLKKALSPTRQSVGIPEYEPDAINYFMAKQILKPGLQRRAVQLLAQAMQPSSDPSLG